MALIACPECNREISDKAAACPHCGSPAAATIKVETAPGAVVTTQATGRQWKILQMIGFLFITAGVISCSARSTYTEGILFTAPLVMIGALFYVIGRVGAWWRHG